MAVFGLPQGGELVVILLIILFGFGPSALIAFVAYRLGMSKGRGSRPGEPRVAPFEPRRENAEPPSGAQPPSDAEPPETGHSEDSEEDEDD